MTGQSIQRDLTSGEVYKNEFDVSLLFEYIWERVVRFHSRSIHIVVVAIHIRSQTVKLRGIREPYFLPPAPPDVLPASGSRRKAGRYMLKGLTMDCYANRPLTCSLTL